MDDESSEIVQITQKSQRIDSEEEAFFMRFKKFI